MIARMGATDWRRTAVSDEPSPAVAPTQLACSRTRIFLTLLVYTGIIGHTSAQSGSQGMADSLGTEPGTMLAGIWLLMVPAGLMISTTSH